MSIETLFEKFHELGDQILGAVIKFKSRNKKDKHVKYKKKRLSELGVIWKEFQETVTKIKTTAAEPDSEYIEDKKEYEEAYEWCKDELNKINNVEEKVNPEADKAEEY